VVEACPAVPPVVTAVIAVAVLAGFVVVVTLPAPACKHAPVPSRL